MIFPAAITFEMSGGRDMPGVACFMTVSRRRRLRRAIEEARSPVYGTHINFAGRGEMLPNPDTYCEIDPDVVDQWASPRCVSTSSGRITSCSRQDMQETFRAIVETMGGGIQDQDFHPRPVSFGIEEGGKIIHEVGTAAHGRRSEKPPCFNGFCQAHDVKNLFVTDGAPLVTNPDKNPTLTIMALSWRASEYLLQEAKKGNL